MNISKSQQRTLHALAQGGAIILDRDEDTGDLIGADCITRDGWRLSDCTLDVFRSLKRRRFIASSGGGPYRITRDGLLSLRSQLDNRVTMKRL
ncbi:MAG: YjhX family toxin [Caulobacter sp.]|nr:YjhX family toxin [Caulobacter sp.]